MTDVAAAERQARYWSSSVVAALTGVVAVWVVTHSSPWALGERQPALALMLAPLAGSALVARVVPAARSQSTAQIAGAAWIVLLLFRLFFGIPAKWPVIMLSGVESPWLLAVAPFALALGAVTFAAVFAAAGRRPRDLMAQSLITGVVTLFFSWVAIGPG